MPGDFQTPKTIDEAIVAQGAQTQDRRRNVPVQQPPAGTGDLSSNPAFVEWVAQTYNVGGDQARQMASNPEVVNLYLQNVFDQPNADGGVFQRPR